MNPPHLHDLAPLHHSHSFADEGMHGRERALVAVTLLTLVTMAGELLAGWWTRSLALTADGWHMGTHALALGGAVIAYRLSRRAARESAAGFVFGGWKIEVLAAYTSGLLLMAVALALAWDSVAALRAPRGVAWGDAMVVAVIGLVVNVASAWLLSRGAQPASSPAHAGTQREGHRGQHGPQGHRDHPHDQPHDHPHDHHHDHPHPPHAAPHAHGHDHNFTAAYLHVLADALTSVLAIAALAGGAWFGLPWLDPVAALLGAALIARWSWNMLRSTARALVDATEDPQLAARVRALIEDDGDARIADLHVWQVGSAAWCAALSVVADAPLPAHEYRARLTVLQTLRHVTVEVHRCRGPAAPGRGA